jgi:hypothetical protein
VYPDTKPQLNFDESGICDACRSAEEKEKIDWGVRKKELEKILEQYKHKDGSKYDCIIPFSNSYNKKCIWIKSTFGEFSSPRFYRGGQKKH